MKMKIHTAWCHYAATGEGMTLIAYVAWARDEQHMREKLKSEVDEFWSHICEVREGVVRNDVTRRLWPEELLAMLEQCARDRAIITARNEVYLNMS